MGSFRTDRWEEHIVSTIVASIGLSSKVIQCFCIVTRFVIITVVTLTRK